ncbi:unnamed protein product [Vitrella brassicaformis CCMP3155]|uniref:Uncharacterized protein n=1 Tax=Vitrella brassicaformis (strain CCMP3155) TaxID=1169540 RepID=A0A0G4G1T2_VITBC|nr:unnamed protein product [Vitrella brassicaformis CCMP3155]|eukprot:CEM22001.1 unnamed protein product [Vitrella brassicaformis CCMP3155]
MVDGEGRDSSAKRRKTEGAEDEQATHDDTDQVVSKLRVCEERLREDAESLLREFNEWVSSMMEHLSQITHASCEALLSEFSHKVDELDTLTKENDEGDGHIMQASQIAQSYIQNDLMNDSDEQG